MPRQYIIPTWTWTAANTVGMQTQHTNELSLKQWTLETPKNETTPHNIRPSEVLKLIAAKLTEFLLAQFGWTAFLLHFLVVFDSFFEFWFLTLWLSRDISEVATWCTLRIVLQVSEPRLCLDHMVYVLAIRYRSLGNPCIIVFECFGLSEPPKRFISAK